MAEVMGSRIGSVTGIFGKDDLKNVRNEPDLLLPDFLPTGLENLTMGEVPACSRKRWSGLSQRSAREGECLGSLGSQNCLL